MDWDLNGLCGRNTIPPCRYEWSQCILNYVWNFSGCDAVERDEHDYDSGWLPRSTDWCNEFWATTSPPQESCWWNRWLTLGYVHSRCDYPYIIEPCFLSFYVGSLASPCEYAGWILLWLPDEEEQKNDLPDQFSGTSMALLPEGNIVLLDGFTFLWVDLDGVEN